MKQKQEKLNQISRNNSKEKILKVQTQSKNQLDDRWLQFKFIGKNLQTRSYHVSAIYKNYFYIHGGYDVDKGILSDFYRLNLESQTSGFKWEQLKQDVPNYPGKLKSHSCVKFQNSFVIFGGQIQTGKNNNCVYIYEIIDQKWSKINPNINIPGLQSHSAVIYNQTIMLVYGGFIDTSAKYNSQIFQFNLKTLKWNIFFDPKPNQTIPQPRGNFGLVNYETKLWLFGGTNGTKTLNDLWKFDLVQKKWEQVKNKQNVPEPRRSHSMIIYKNYFYIFGGIQDITKEKNDIYIFDLKSYEWTKIMNSSNLIYECSPTIKNNKSTQKKIQSKQKSSSPKRLQNRISLIHADSSKYEQKTNTFNEKPQGMKKILQENKLKKFYQKKTELLRQFNQATKLEQNKKRKLSPTSQSMIKTLQVIGDQQQSKKIIHKQVVYDPTGSFIIGKKPCARDAQTAALYNDKMLIFGGDRHLMSFSDLYYFDLNKAIQSRKYYNPKK